jgi:hypothetical protein
MHAFDGVHERPAVQSMQAPPKQARLVPQVAPLDIAFPLSVQTPSPVVQEIVPV